MAINDGGPAFPQYVAEIHGVATHSGEFGLPGMSLRDYFAAQALIALGINNGYEAFGKPHFKEEARKAYQCADAMLKAREIEPVPEDGQ